MHDLSPITALGAATPRVTGIGRCVLRERSEFALASVALRAGGGVLAMPVLDTLIGASLPGPGMARSTGDMAAIWMGPGQWLISAPEASGHTLHGKLKDSLGISASVTDQSGGWVRFDLDGVEAVAVLERLCAVDSAAMKADAATRTVMEHHSVLLHCHAPGTSFAIYGPGSSAASLWHAIVSVMTGVA